MSSPFRNFNNLTRPSQVRAALIEMDALKLRAAGYSLDDIADQLGITREQAGRATRRGMKALKAANKETNSDARDLDLMRLDIMLMGVWPSARSGDPKAIKASLEIMDRRAKLLGLDKLPAEPEKQPNAKVDLANMSLSDLEALEALAAKALGAQDGDEDEEDLSQEVHYGDTASLGEIIQMDLDRD